MTDLQRKCDVLTQCVLFRRLSQPCPKPQLYLCEIKESTTDKNTAFVVLSHDFPVSRMVICGGNAGFCNPSTFEGRSSGVKLPFRCECFLSVTTIDL